MRNTLKRRASIVLIQAKMTTGSLTRALISRRIDPISDWDVLAKTTYLDATIACKSNASTETAFIGTLSIIIRISKELGSELVDVAQ
jgi:hypothetical protein